MKRILVLFLGLFAIFGIVSCSKDNPYEIEYNLNEQLDVPTNLSVNETTKTLTWDAVDSAVRYNVYVDGELEAEVTSTTFDFSGITGDRIMFTVKAMAPKGMQNSNVSTTIAFVANRESEISQMKLSIQTRGMLVNDEDAFATELVNKGMLSDDFNKMMEDMEDMEAVIGVSDITGIYTGFNQLLETTDMAMIEALISSLIKVELRTMLQSEINDYRSIPTNPYIEEEIAELEMLLQFIDDKGDEAVKSAMIVIEYLVDVQNGIDANLVANMDTLVNSNELTSANVSMLVTVKNDLINNLKDNLPELQDVIVLNSTLVAFMQSTGEMSINTTIVSIPKQSAQSLMSMELFFNYILEMDEAYVNAFVQANNSLIPEGTKSFVKENIRLIDQYLEKNDVLIQQLNNIYTDEEKEILFYDYYIEAVIAGYANMMYVSRGDSEGISTIIEEQIDFANIMILQETMGEAFSELLNAIIESDYAVVDAYYELVAYQRNTQVQINEVDPTWNLMKEIVTLINPILQDTTVEEYTAMVDLLFGQLIVQYEMQALLMGPEYTYFSEMIDIIGYIETGVKNTTTNQLSILKDFVDLLDQSNYIDEIVELRGSENDEYGTEEYWGSIIILANAYLEFYGDSQEDIDAIIDEVMNVLSEPDVRVQLNLTTTDLERIETTINSYFTDLTAQANLVKDYDYTNLTTTQQENLGLFMNAMLGFMIMM